MEKKQNMSSVDELCVKYVFDELDPSEITLVEQAMMHDQNLLIEVESLKSTWRRIKKLPDLTPPPNISEAVIDHAKDYSTQQQFFVSGWKNPGLLATAAIVIFSLLISTAYLLPLESTNGGQAEEAVTASLGASASSTLQTPGLYGQFFSIWNGDGNIVTVGAENKAVTGTEADSLQRQLLLPSHPESQSIILSPAFRDFQLTGARN